MIKRLIWIVSALALIDVGVNLATAYPDMAPADAEIGPLQRYFNYGLSIEHKVRWMVAGTDEATAPLARAGWLTAPPAEDHHLVQKHDVVVYGMSFSARIGAALESTSGMSVLSRGGPAAPINRSFADYLLHRDGEDVPVVVLGVLASSVPYTNTITHMTWNFEAPSPHFYPKFGADPAGEMVRFAAPVASLDEFRKVLEHRSSWKSLQSVLAEHDAFYDPWSFEADWLDHSTVGRLLRRAWAQRHHREVVQRYHDSSGFTNEDGTLTVLRSILAEFGRLVRRDGALPVVLLINDQGYSDHLYQAVRATLKAEDIPFVSSHETVSADEFEKFLPDGHFHPGVDIQLAHRVLEVIKSRRSP